MGLAVWLWRRSTTSRSQACFPTAGVPGCNTQSSSSTKTGWVAGAGVEWAFAPNWSMKAEYLYADLGKHTTYRSITTTAAGCQPVPGGDDRSQSQLHRTDRPRRGQLPLQRTGRSGGRAILSSPRKPRLEKPRQGPGLFIASHPERCHARFRARYEVALVQQGGRIDFVNHVP